MLIRLRLAPERTRTRSGACLSNTYVRIAPTRILLDVNTSPEAQSSLGESFVFLPPQDGSSAMGENPGSDQHSLVQARKSSRWHMVASETDDPPR